MKQILTNIKENKKKTVYIMVLIIIIIASGIFIFYKYKMNQRKQIVPKSHADLLQNLQNTSKPVTATIKERTNQLKKLEKSSNKVKLNQQSRILILKQLSKHK